MHRFKNTPKNKFWLLVMIFVITLTSTLTVDVSDVQAGGGGFPIFSIIPAWMKRNRTYEVANDFIKEKTEYYDALRDTAAQQLLDREMTFGLRDNQVAAYMKVITLIEQERDSMYDFAESEKKGARDEFIGVLSDQVKNVMLSSTPATRLLGALERGLNSSQGFLDAALTKITGGAGGFMADVAKVRRIADRMAIAGGVIGGDFGKSIQKLGTNISKLTKKPTAEIEAGLIQVQEELGALGDYVQDARNEGRVPVASQTTREVVIHLVTGEPANPAIEAIADMFVSRHARGEDFRDRARDILLGNASARCRAKVDQIHRVLFKLETEPAAEDTSDIDDISTCEVVEIDALVEEVVEAVESAQVEDPEEVETGEETVADQPSQEDSSQPPPSEGADSGQPPSTSEYVWVLADTVVNYNNDQTEFYGGGADPYYFPEARFEGKSVVFGCSANNFTVHDVDVDHEYVYRDAQVGVNFDSPPAQLDPGQVVELAVNANHSGTINEGGGGIGILFQYHLNNNALEPVFSYSPWAPNFTGQSSQDFSFTAPGASEGGEFIFGAGLWNVPPCNVSWTYRAQLNPNFIGEQAPQQEQGSAAGEPGEDWKEERCADLREEVASKVSIARGADTADLALGIIGHIYASRGDVQINYCEGGSGTGEKGIPIRVGDCVKTGSDGRARIIFNDQDDKYNADPTTLGVSRNSELCFPSFAVHRDDGKPGLIDHLKGAIRIFTEGWRTGSGFGVNVSVRAAVTVASDVILNYDPEKDVLKAYVNEGTVQVSETSSSQSQTIFGGESLTVEDNYLSEVDEITDYDWDLQLLNLDLEFEESEVPPDASFSDLKDRFSLPNWAIVLIVTSVCGGSILLLLVVVGVVLRQRKKRTTIED